MEYPAKKDYFIRFKAVYNDKNEFIDYILINFSENLKASGIVKYEELIGKKLSELFIENEDIIPGLRELYYHMIPNTSRKFESYIEKLDRWYLINIFSDEKDYLILFYTDITAQKPKIKDSIPNTEYVESENIINIHCFKDNLTGLYSKEFFELELSRLDTQRQLPISIIVADVNGLKLINDAFGHFMGDEALKTIANILKKIFRKEDIVSRFGGDEFFILLPQTTERTSLSIIERVKKKIDKNPLDFLKLSMSFGAATKTREEENILDIVKKSEERMYFNKLIESKEAKRNMIDYIKERLAKISFETEHHHNRLEYLSIKLADKIGISEIEKEELKLLCKYHDIGKAGIPNYILNKKEPLSNEEWDKLRRHSEIGYHIMQSAGEPIAIDELILMHHERWDGKGYPGLLKGEEIPKTVRIFAIADAYEAMVNYRPYKERKSHTEALEEIKANAGTQFDPKLAELFIELMKLESEKAT